MKKLNAKFWTILILVVVIVIGLTLTCVITATASDRKRFVYELNEDGLSYSVVGIKNAYRGGWFAKESIEVPQTYKGYPVTAIKQIRNLQKTQTVILPMGLKEIGASAFYASSITSIVIPNSVETIGISAFENCTQLSEVTLPESLTAISSATFRSCFSLSKITLPSTVTSIGSEAFANCYALESLTLPVNLATIETYAFLNCTGLTSIELPSKLDFIGDNAFEKCFSLIEVCNNSMLNVVEGDDRNNGLVAQYALHVYSGSASSALIKKDNDVFYDNGDTVLFVKHYGTETELTMPDFNGKEYAIHDYAFYGNSTLQEVTIPNSITKIGWHAFDNCSALKNVTIGDGVKLIDDEAFLSCKKLTDVTIGNSVERIGMKAFFECERLEKIVLPDSVVIIDSEAFSWCAQLKDVTIGKGVKEIGERAFFNCTHFVELNYGGTVNQWKEVLLGDRWTWDNNSTKRDRSCEKVICSDGEVEIPTTIKPAN